MLVYCYVSLCCLMCLVYIRMYAACMLCGLLFSCLCAYCCYQFRRRHDYPLIKNDVWSNLPNTKNGGFVFDRRSIDLLTKSIRKASEM